MEKKSRRKRFMFWLDYKKQSELDLANEIGNLKQTRSFARAIRDGLRLFVSLSKGETTVLEELFPHVVAKLRGGSTDNGAGGLSEEKLRAIIIEATQGPPINLGKQHMSHVPMLPKPLILDDDIPKAKVIKTEKTDDKTGEQNFLNSLSALMNG